MITDVDTEFHPRDPEDRTWTETMFLPFVVPEEGIFGNVYVLARPNVGVATSSILVGQGFCPQPYDVDFTDPQVHLPCPTSFAKFSLENGLTVDAPTPGQYDLSYRNALGACSFDLAFRGLHDPFDPNDPEQNPLLATDRATGDTRHGDEWENGHYEVKGHITGTLELRGRRYTVDCYEGMDHSWGPRTETGTRSVAWMSVNFGPELAMHLAVLLDLRDGRVTYERLRFGFVVEHGEVTPLVDARITAEHTQMLAMNNHIVVTDARGRSWEFFGTAISSHPWYSFNPSHVSYQGVFRYHWGDKVGYGEAADIYGLDYLAERMSRHGRDRGGRA
ncbi:hypothetical protein [Streptomyces sp. NPDC058424]|uniref:DUF7064 domain-containing protein n=1 Tax=Streptomyces sp. NPDC058424 TaxID=3346491 RepID=UPI003649EB7C